MLKQILVFVYTLAVSHAVTPAPAQSQGVQCGYMPENLFLCIGNPAIISADVLEKCMISSPCDRLECVFKEYGWLTNKKVDKGKVSRHFDTFATAHPAWSAAVNHLKAACLGNSDLPAQGTAINCPAYDIFHCAFVTFIKKASPSQWYSGVECTKAREFAAACPICPNECLEAQVPKNSCHACLSLPRSA